MQIKIIIKFVKVHQYVNMIELNRIIKNVYVT